MDRLNRVKSLPFILVLVCLGQIITVQTEDIWGDWSVCTRTCGGGVSYKEKLCRNNNTCTEPRIRYRMCNTRDCPAGSVDFRFQQCARYNDKPYKGKKLNWMPVSVGPSKCELNCMPKGYRFYIRFATKVIDGTRCSDDSFDVCINGNCEPVGCDKLLNSNSKFDKCRVCQGNNRSCRKLSGSFTKDAGYDYMEITTIPAGATSIKVTEKGIKNNYIAIRESNRYLLNGDWTVASQKTMDVHGSHAAYIRKKDKHELLIHGPTNAPLVIEALVVNAPASVDYEYYLPLGASTPADSKTKYRTRVGQWSECSKSCAGGVHHRAVYCESVSSGKRVSRSLCRVNKEIEKESCNTQPCGPEWYTTDWSPCSESCGTGTKVRRVHCVRRVVGRDIEMLRDDLCDGKKPEDKKQCVSYAKCARWVTGEWSECSKYCGGGHQTRSVTCKIEGRGRDSNTIPSQSCRSDEKPIDRQTCNSRSCNVYWATSSWSECSANCGQGVRSRTVSCKNRDGEVFSMDSCDASTKPKETEECRVSKQCLPMWHATQWSKCTRKCSDGYQMRSVFCVEKRGSALLIIDSGKCKPEFRMPKVRRCKQNKACFSQYFVSPWRKCSVSCGGGIRIREVRCYADMKVDTAELACKKLVKPAMAEMCNRQPCANDQQGTKPVSVAPTRGTTQRETVPTITSIEGKSRVRIGEAVTFRCIVYGIPAPSVHWSLNKRQLSTDDLRYRFQDGGRTLTINKFYQRDEGTLTCHARNRVGNADRSKTLVSYGTTVVKPTEGTQVPRGRPPTIIAVHGPRSLQVGESADFRCEASGSPRLHVYWTLNNYPIRGQNPRFKLLNFDRTFVITEVNEQDEGLLTCYARNSFGSAAKSERLEVNAKPTASVTPVRRTVYEGESVTLNCDVRGKPTPTVIWKKGGTVIQRTDNGRIRIGSRSISIKNVLLEDSGAIECVAENSVGTSTAVMTLIVEKKRTSEDCVDSSGDETNCRLIKSIGFCAHSYYSKVCCATCSA